MNGSGPPPSSTERPPLSVIVLNFNYGRFISECLDSILSQTWTNFELVIIDDCSTDNSLEVIEPYLQDSRVHLVVHPENRGVVRSLIDGMELYTRGDFVCVISSDDVVRNANAFERQMAALQSKDTVAFCFSGYDRFRSDTSETIEIFESFDKDAAVDSAEFLPRYFDGKTLQVLHSGTIVRRAAYRACGGYRADFRYAVDWALWPLLSLEGEVAYCAGALYGYRCHAQQMTRSYATIVPMMQEMLTAVDTACARAALRGIDIAAARRAGIRRALVAAALDDAFDGRRRLAMARWTLGLLLSPLCALSARDWWTVPARVLLGQRGFRIVHRAKRSLA